MLKYYKIQVNEFDETGVDFNAFVDAPAHMKNFIAFDKTAHYVFSEEGEKRIVTGVLISVGTPIYRNSVEHGEHYVIFDAETTELINRKMSRNKFMDNLNKDHDMNQLVKGAIQLERYHVSNSDPKRPNVPEAFAHQNLQDMSLIGSYLIEDDTLWAEVKAGKFKGFSVEGWFDKKEIKIKNKMSKKTKTIWDLFKSTPKTEIFGSATSAEGAVISWEGDLADGVALFVELEGEKVPTQGGEYQLTLEDGSVKVVTVDDNGLVTSIADAMSDDTDEVVEELKEQVADAMRKLASDTNDRFVAIETKNDELVAENEKLKLEIETFKTSGKFGANPKKTDAPKEKMTIAEMVANKKN